MRALVVVVVVLLSTTTAIADRDAMFAGRRELVTALAKRDVATIKARAQLPLPVAGLWFDTAACKKFGGAVEVSAEQLAELVGCFADLGVQALDDRAYVSATYGPGAMLAVTASDDGKQLLGLVGYTMEEGAATVHPDVFAKHVAKFQRQVVPDASTKRFLDKSRDAFLQGKLYVCTTAKGKPDGSLAEDASLRVPTSEPGAPPDFTAVPGYTTAVENAVARWKIKPFIAHGKAVRVCTSFPVGYPESRLAPLAPDWPPPPAGGPQLTPPPSPPSPVSSSGTAPQNVAPTTLEATRIRGNKVILPDDATKLDIARTGKAQVVGAWKLCLDETGAAAEVTRLKSTGFEAYDKRIAAEMRTWAYRPFVVDGKPVKVCTAVTFIYSQQP